MIPRWPWACVKRVASDMSTATIERGAASVIPDALAECHGVEDLWVYYKATGDVDARERLILHYSPLVKYIAGRIKSGLPATNDLGDLIGDGMFGLFDAIEKFDPDRAIKFETYAGRRIKGAIFDKLRTLDWVPRRTRDELRIVDRARRALETRLQCTPTAAEVATEAGRTVREVHAAHRGVTVLSLDAPVSNADDMDRGTLGDTYIGADGMSLDAAIEAAELKREVRLAVQQLPARDRIVITLYYFEDLTLSEIGRVLGLTEGRICQIHKRASALLRTALAAA